jgi:hypothetical protein
VHGHEEASHSLLTWLIVVLFLATAVDLSIVIGSI